MAYPFDDKTYNRMPYGTPAPFSFGGSILPLPRVQAGDDFGRTSSEFPESTIGYGFGRSASSVPAWQVASSDDPTYPSYPRPGYAPPLPDIFAPWRRYAVPAHEDLWRFLFQDGFGWGSRGGDKNGPGCKEEWEAARDLCEKELSKVHPDEGVTGGYQNTEDCAKGNVSEKCGGNVYKRKPFKPYKRYKLD